MRLPLWIAGRYLRARPRTGFVRLLTGISIAGVAVGVTALLVVLAVMNGFEGEVQSRIAGNDAHVVLLGPTTDGVSDGPALANRLARVPGVLGASAFTYAKAMVFHEGLAEGLVVKGVDLGHERQVTTIGNSIQPPMAAIPDTTAEGEPGIVLGSELAAKLGATIGDRVLLATLQGDATSAFGYSPKLRPFRIVGLFTSGLYTYDSSFGFTSVGASQRFFQLGDRVTGVEVKLDDPFEAKAVGRHLAAAAGAPYWIRDWMDMNRNLFAALQLEKLALFVIVTIIVLVAGFAIIGHLILLVAEKRKEIGILKAMGATSGSIGAIFLAAGMLIGLVGTVAGSAFGLGIIWVQNTYKIIRLAGDVYQIDHLPMKLSGGDFALVIGATLVISFLATISPARRAASLAPVDVLRYE